MTRVRYLARLAGPTERRPAPLLRPPRRLFPHEPPPVEPLLPSPPTAEAAGDQPTQEEPILQSEPAPIKRERAENAPAVAVPERTRSLDGPATSAVPAAPRVEQVLRGHPVEEPSPPPQPQPVRVARAQMPPPPARHPERTAERTPASRALEPARSTGSRRSVTTLEPSRLRPPVASPPERAAASRPEPTRARAAGLHIGSIDVTVIPTPVAPGEPVLTAPPTPVHRPPAPFDPRGASMSRWFGLAQR
jgi:hypothetical protein